MEIKSKQLDSLFSVEVNGTVIQNVSDYKITSSAHGNTELDLKLIVSDDIKEIEVVETIKKVDGTEITRYINENSGGDKMNPAHKNLILKALDAEGIQVQKITFEIDGC